jgi:ribonuclease-3
VPGVTGVQTALDLRAPDRKNERHARGEPKATVTEALAERPAITAAPTVAPLAVIRAAHVEYSNQAAPDKEKTDRMDKAEKTDKADKSDAPPRSTDKPAASRSREPAPGVAEPAELEPGIADAVQTRVADAGH